jgi:hypothetical protein
MRIKFDKKNIKNQISRDEIEIFFDTIKRLRTTL